VKNTKRKFVLGKLLIANYCIYLQQIYSIGPLNLNYRKQVNLMSLT